METLYRKVAVIIENAIDDFSSKWSSHIEKDSGITEHANEITNIIETETAQLKADKAELLEALENTKTAFRYFPEKLDEIESLIQKHKQ